MDDASAGAYATVGTRIERETYNRFTDICDAIGTTKSSYVRTLILREIAGESDHKVTDPISAMTLGVMVSQRLLAAVPPDILDQAVSRLRQEGGPVSPKSDEAST